MKRFYLLLFLFFTLNLRSQTTIALPISVIKSNFTIASIKAYQKSATYKVEDFYHYLTLISNENTTESLKKELKKAIFKMYKNQNYKIVDPLAVECKPILLSEFIDKVYCKNYTFSASNFENSIVASNFWTTQYKLVISQNEFVIESIYYQKIEFKPVVKTFGSTKKQVWSLFLAEIFLPIH